MSEFRKKLSAREINTGRIIWDVESDIQLQAVIPKTLVFDLIFEEQVFSNLAIEWEKHSLFIGEPVSSAMIDSEIVLSLPRDKGSTVNCQIFTPQDKMIIRKKLSHQEYQGRYLKWFAREDKLYTRLLTQREQFSIEIIGKVAKNRVPDFEKRKLKVGEMLRSFRPGDYLLIRWKYCDDSAILLIEKEYEHSSTASDGSIPLRSLVARLLSRPLDEFNKGELKALIVLLEENKKLWERISDYQEENRHLKEQVNMLESLFEQFTANSFFNSKKEFEQWTATHVSLFEKGLKVLDRNYSVTVADGKKRRIDMLCQDKKGILVVVQILFEPDSLQIAEAIETISHLRADVNDFGSKLTDGQFKSADIRGLIVSNYDKADLVEPCMQKQIKLCLVKSGCLIDLLD